MRPGPSAAAHPRAAAAPLPPPPDPAPRPSGSAYGALSAQLADGAGPADRDATYDRIFSLIDAYEAILEESFGLR